MKKVGDLTIYINFSSTVQSPLCTSKNPFSTSTLTTWTITDYDDDDSLSKEPRQLAPVVRRVDRL